jgi:DNA repair ATPase RecN
MDLEQQLEKYKNRVIDLEAISKKHQDSYGKLIEENKKLKNLFNVLFHITFNFTYRML